MISAILICRRSKFETQLLIQSWRVQWEDIETLKGMPQSQSTVAGKSSGHVGSVVSISIVIFEISLNLKIHP